MIGNSGVGASQFINDVRNMSIYTSELGGGDFKDLENLCLIDDLLANY